MVIFNIFLYVYQRVNTSHPLLRNRLVQAADSQLMDDDLTLYILSLSTWGCSWDTCSNKSPYVAGWWFEHL